MRSWLGFFPAIFGAAADLTTDAQRAALAVENQADLHSNDPGFSRFDGLRWRNPLKSLTALSRNHAVGGKK